MDKVFNDVMKFRHTSNVLFCEGGKEGGREEERVGRRKRGRQGWEGVRERGRKGGRE